jgi:4'-phosphopantetheinyl transferase
MQQVHILYTRLGEQLPPDMYARYWRLFPEFCAIRNARYKHWQDRQLNLLGLLLLRHGLKLVGLNERCLKDLSYNRFGKPFISENIHFNISHSGEYVICGIADNMRLGIDIEQIKPLSFADVKPVMTAEQWELVSGSTDPLRTFYTYWTWKESIVKADGRGLSLPIDEIAVDERPVKYDNDNWYVSELHIDKNYAACIALAMQHASCSISYCPHPEP